MRQLIRDLHAAGWHYRRELVDGGHDYDGSPIDREVRRFHRDDEVIEVEQYSVTYEPGNGDQFGFVAVGEDWIERNGVEGLRRLALALGILAAAPEGLTRLTVYLTNKALMSLNAAAAANRESETDTVNRALVEYADTAGAWARLTVAVGRSKAKASTR